jgi:PAS domain S-box-containing protein
MEDELRKSEERFRKIFDESQVGIITSAPDYRFEKINPAFCRMIGYTATELASLTFADITHPDDIRKDIENIKKLGLGEISFYKAEKRYLRKTGETIWGNIVVSSVRNNNGTLLYYLVMIEDITVRKRAEEAIRESEERFRMMFENVFDGISIYREDPDPSKRRLVECNERYAAMAGRSREELLQRGSTQGLQITHEETVNIKRLESLAGGKAYQGSFSWIRPDGKDNFVEYVGVPITWRGKSHSIGIDRDITERKRADEALTYERNLLKALMDNIPDHVYFKDNESRFLRMSRSQANRFGLDDPAQAVGKTDFEFFAEEHARTAHEDEQQIMKSGIAIIGIEEKESWPDGSESWVSTTKVPLQDAQGQIIGTFGVSRDITERKRVEESLIRLNKAVEASGEVIFMTDRNGIFSFVNTSFTTLYGYEKTEVVGKTTPRILKSGRQLPDHYTEFWQALTNKQTTKADLINRTKDGRLLTIEATANPILDTKGSIIGFLAIQRDVTQQRTLEEQIRQSQKMESLGTLASGIAHDFNNILSIILGHASLIEKYQYDPERFRDSLQTITNASTRGASLVRQMLTFARKSATEFRPLLINESIQEIQRLLHETFPKPITLAFDVAERLPLITADATQIHQVLLNLCVNARDAMDGKGTLTVSARLVRGETVRHRFVNAKSSTYIEVTVADTGAGMDEATRRRIFEPFFTTKTFGKGTGLGLAVVFGIMESHSGFIDVASEVGRGTTFSLYFPIKSFSVESVSDQSIIQKEAVGGTEVILVVEDEETLKESVRQILTVNGYTVLSAEDGEQAMAMLDRFHNDIALVICDLGLPKFSGLEVLKKLKALNPSVKFILGTGYIEPAERTAVLREGANDIVLKPYITNEFLRRVRDVLDAK